MQLTKIPIAINLVRSATSKMSYNGIIPGKVLHRLQELCMHGCSDIEVALETGIDHQGIAFLKGTAKTKVILMCQRCFGELKLDVDITLCLGNYKEELEDSFPESYEPLEVDEHGEFRLHNLIEDEVILVIPFTPMHDDVNCHVGSKDVTIGHIEVIPEKPNPFAVLEKLKTK